MNGLRLCLLLLAVYCQGTFELPTPGRPVGFVYKGGKANAPVQLEAFVDLTCPDSRTVWPVLKEIAEFYGQDKLRLIVYLFPLPYHRNAHIAASSAFFVEAVKPSLVFDWMTTMFNNQDSITGAKAYDKTGFDAIDIIAAHGQEIGIDEAALKQGITDSRYDRKAVISFKYGIKRGVYATPFYFMNGVFLKDDTPLWPTSKWKQVIDSLLKKKP